MTSFVFNVVKGRVATYLDLVPSNSALVVVPLESSGLESKAVLEDKTSLSAVLSGSTNEQTTMGRKTVTSITSSVENDNNRYVANMASQTWIAATGNAVGGFLICYDPDTTAGTDSDLVPISYYDWNRVPDGNDLVLNLNAFLISI